jgi:hypothetical protein
MREPEMICPKPALFRLANGGRAVAGRYPTALAVSQVAPKAALSEPLWALSADFSDQRILG